MRNLLSLCICALVLMACSSDDNSNILPAENLGLKVVNSATITENLNNLLGISDIITYSISVKNIGDVSLTGVSINNTFTDLEGNSLSLTSGPDFVSADAGSSEGAIGIDETATYSATYTITQSDVDAGGLSLSVIANGNSPESENVSDVSDNGDDSDGNDSNDPTETLIEFDPLIISEYHLITPDSGSITYRYVFDSNGRISKLINLIEIDNNYSYSFNSNNLLSNISKIDSDDNIVESIDIIYNSENKIISIGNRTFTYNPDLINYVPIPGYAFPFSIENFYIEDTTYYISPEPPVGYEQEITFDYFKENSEGQITGSCDFYEIYRNHLDEITYQGCFTNVLWGYGDNQLTLEGTADFASFITFDANTNPMFQGETNLANIAPFFNHHSSPINVEIVFKRDLLSINNIILIEGYEKDPEHTEFLYALNSINLPIESTIQYYYFDGLDSEHHFSNYYYQGDDIPE